MLRPDSPSPYPSLLRSTISWILGPQIYPRDNYAYNYFSTTLIYPRESLLPKIARENKEKDESETVKPLNNADKERVG